MTPAEHRARLDAQLAAIVRQLRDAATFANQGVRPAREPDGPVPVRAAWLIGRALNHLTIVRELLAEADKG